MYIAVQNKLKWYFKDGIRPQKHKRSDRIILLGDNEVINLFERYIKVMTGYLTSYIKESPFVLFRPHALLRLILDRCVPCKIIALSVSCTIIALLMVFCAPLLSIAFDTYTYTGIDNLIGMLRYYEVKENESLIEIARYFDLGYNEIVDANPSVDPFVPPPGKKIKIPTLWILPEKRPEKGIVVNLSEMRLYYFFKKDKKKLVMTFPVGIGDEGAETPPGVFKITEKIESPSWKVPESIRKERPELPAVVPPGPDNPLGSHALRLSWSSILIHGTDKPWGIGRNVSHGCIRLYPEDIVKLFYKVRVNTTVYIVREPIKIGKKGRDIYIEVHNDNKWKDRNYYDEAIMMLVRMNLINSVDLEKLYKAIKDKNGIPVKIGHQ